jgi:SAM-dependent methyltransferase
MMRTKDITEANRRAWDAVAPIHRRKRSDHLTSGFSTPGSSCLDAVALEHLGRIGGVSGKRIAQLCCNNGRELISLMNLGAASAVGFDISEVVIDEARQLATAAAVSCSFVHSDVYDIPDAYCASFDLVYISVGALGWMPDLARFLQVAARLLAAPGWLFVYEMHPILDMFDPLSKTPTVPADSYFRTEPYVETAGLDYVGGTDHEGPPQYWFHHSLASLFNTAIGAGFRVVSFHEFEHDVTGLYEAVAQCPQKVPMSYILTATKD